MINSVIVTNHLGDSLTMELRFPEKSGFLIRSIEGLGPSKANINTTDMSGFDGAMYNSARALSRNIVFTLSFLENPTIETTRRNSYKYFPLKRKVQIQINTDERTYLAEGYIESNEPDIFSSEEGSVISVICPDAFLYSLYPESNVFSLVEPRFKFPFSNESTTEKLLIVSELIVDTTKNIFYEGDVPVGIIFYIHSVGYVFGIEIINARTLETISINSTEIIAITGGNIDDGDDIIISTVKGHKYAVLIRDGITYNILNALGEDPSWFELEKGDNIFAYTATSGLVNLRFELSYHPAFEGA